MVVVAALSLVSLLVPLSCCQSTQRSPPQIHHPLSQTQEEHMEAYTIDQSKVKVGLFIAAAAAGVFFLMAAVYCIYTQFYTKQQYLHTPMDQEMDVSLDPPHSEIFHDTLEPADRKSCYGSLSDAPSIISVPPSLSPPLSSLRFPSRFLSSRSLRTISAKDLEKNCI